MLCLLRIFHFFRTSLNTHLCPCQWQDGAQVIFSREGYVKRERERERDVNHVSKI